MSGLGLGGGLGGFHNHHQQRPFLQRTYSQVDFTGPEDEDSMYSSGAPDYPNSRPSTPHEPLSLDFGNPQDVRPDCTQSTSPPHSPGPLEAPLEADYLPPLPTLHTSFATFSGTLPALNTGPFTSQTSQLLLDDNIFHRPVPQRAPQPQVRRITPTPLPAPTSTTTTSSSVLGRKRHAPSSVSGGGGAFALVSMENVAAAPTPSAPTRKKRRGQRPNTYQCLYKGELYECPHGCDIVPKDWLYSVMSR
jgi:hypothetical protein